MTTAVEVHAYANIAFAKYWGKRPSGDNCPATDSVGANLAALRSVSRVTLIDAPRDHLELDGVTLTGKGHDRLARFLDVVRARARTTARVKLIAHNEFPTAAGLASSASGFAALTLAASKALGANFTEAELSALARIGSGSAARSIPGGYVRMLADAPDPHAVSIAPPDNLPLEFAIGVVDVGEKDISSRDGMNHCAETSTYHPAWLARAAIDADTIASAIVNRDIDTLGETAEANALAMHADGFAARPPIVYFMAPTLAGLALARTLRRDNHRAWFTCDAGPHPIIFFDARNPDTRTAVVTGLRAIPGIRNVITSTVTGAANVVATTTA